MLVWPRTTVFRWSPYPRDQVVVLVVVVVVVVVIVAVVVVVVVLLSLGT